jgi:hypothetical protein
MGTIQCKKCNQTIEVKEGKNAKQVLRGHQIHCKAYKEDEEKQEEVRLERKRKERVPFGTPKMRFPNREDDGYVYRVFNDQWSKEPGRIERAQAAGYEAVDEPLSRQPVGVNEDGSPIMGVLMRIPKEWYDEDQAAKQVELDKVDEQIYGGTFQEKPGDKRYIPRDGGVRREIKQTP